MQSTLGEPLRAEIDIPDINSEELSSLKAAIAAPSAFTAAGLEYSSAMSGTQVTIQRRGDGRTFLRLTGERAIQEPFVDMILEASWSSGRIVRDYTMLFDPPATRSAPALTPPQTTAAPASVTPAFVQGPNIASAASQPATSAPAIEPAPARPGAASKGTSTSAAATTGAAAGQTVVVKDGDYASKIAAKVKPAGVSLDQMLVALMRSNPDAFVNKNLNRLRTGSVLEVPTTEQATAVSAAEASQMVVAQSKDFNEFRRNLATNAPKADVAAADRKSAGKVEAKVEDKKSAAATPDKLTLSKGAVQGKSGEAKIAKERADKEAAARSAEIAKNIADLSKLNAKSPVKPGAPTAPVAAADIKKPAPPVTAPTVPVAAAPPPAVVASTPPAPAVPAPAVPVPSPQAEAPAASAPSAPKPVAAVPVPPEEPGMFDDLLNNDYLLPAGGGLLAVLGAFAFWRMRQSKKKGAQVDSSFLESRLQPDSFFGASGGQRVDTANEGPVSASSMVYSASQLDAADDVDPVAEADVYLAYGRDLQAEEILKEAVRHNPARLAIHTKLMEIFAKRRDTQSFQNAAQDAFKLTGGDSPEWQRICEMGLSIDPGNRLYQPGGASQSSFAALQPAPAPAPSFGVTQPQSVSANLAPAPAGMDLDLDLDFSADEPAINDVTGGTATPPKADQTAKMAASPAAEMSLDFDVSAPVGLTASIDPLPSIAMPMVSSGSGRAGSGKGMDFQSTDTMEALPVAPDADKTPTGMMEFDLGSLSLDLDTASASLQSGSDSTSGEDPLETKLALAQEFISIGDDDGARALVEEVVAEATGEMRAKAQQVLAKLR